MQGVVHAVGQLVGLAHIRDLALHDLPVGLVHHPHRVPGDLPRRLQFLLEWHLGPGGVDRLRGRGPCPWTGLGFCPLAAADIQPLLDVDVDLVDAP